MNKKVKLSLLAGGVAAGIASLVPLTTYAESVTSSPNPTVTVTVNPVITLDSANNVTVNATSTAIANADLNVKVTANKGYTISLSASQPNLLLGGTDADNKIPGVSSSGAALTANTNGWGIQKKSADNSTSNTTNYYGLTSTPVQFYKATSGTVANGATTTFNVGVTIASTLTAGNYSTNVTVTAATI